MFWLKQPGDSSLRCRKQYPEDTMGNEEENL